MGKIKHPEAVSAFAIYKKREEKNQSKNKIHKPKKSVQHQQKAKLKQALKIEKIPGRELNTRKAFEAATTSSSKSVDKTNNGEHIPELVSPNQPSQNGTTVKDKGKKPKQVAGFPSDDPSTSHLALLKWMISPTSPEDFFSNYWEKKPLHIKRNQSSYNKHILNSRELDRIFRENPLYYNRNVDVVSYENGIKEVYNQEGRAIPAAVWDYYLNGCSVRLLNPHTYNQKVHLLLATLQEYFGTMVGANVYLTPPGSQGFAPHYDDIEAFILQLEGRKHWKLYQPQGSDVLARDSSPNFKSEDLGEPFMELTLEAGDLLYFPRGAIHEGRTDQDAHSLHITVSVYQHTAYVDLLEQILPNALKKAAENDIEFRMGLPVNYLKKVGAVNAEKSSKLRSLVTTKVKKLITTLQDYIDLDLGADQMGRKFMYDSMPPVVSQDEAKRSSKLDGDYLVNGKVTNRCEIGLETRIRLLRYHCLRLVIEDSTCPKLYYNTENARVYHEAKENCLELSAEMVDSIRALQRIYPKYINIEDLPMTDEIIKMQLVSDLWERGLIVTEEPLPSVEQSDDDSN